METEPSMMHDLVVEALRDLVAEHRDSMTDSLASFTADVLERCAYTPALREYMDEYGVRCIDRGNR